jgi:hypothetical protein
MGQASDVVRDHRSELSRKVLRHGRGGEPHHEQHSSGGEQLLEASERSLERHVVEHGERGDRCVVAGQIGGHDIRLNVGDASGFLLAG